MSGIYRDGYFCSYVHTLKPLLDIVDEKWATDKLPDENIDIVDQPNDDLSEEIDQNKKWEEKWTDLELTRFEKKELEASITKNGGKISTTLFFLNPAIEKDGKNKYIKASHLLIGNDYSKELAHIAKLLGITIFTEKDLKEVLQQNKDSLELIQVTSTSPPKKKKNLQRNEIYDENIDPNPRARKRLLDPSKNYLSAPQRSPLAPIKNHNISRESLHQDKLKELTNKTKNLTIADESNESSVTNLQKAKELVSKGLSFQKSESIPEALLHYSAALKLVPDNKKLKKKVQTLTETLVSSNKKNSLERVMNPPSTSTVETEAPPTPACTSTSMDSSVTGQENSSQNEKEDIQCTTIKDPTSGTKVETDSSTTSTALSQAIPNDSTVGDVEPPVASSIEDSPFQQPFVSRNNKPRIKTYSKKHKQTKTSTANKRVKKSNVDAKKNTLKSTPKLASDVDFSVFDLPDTPPSVRAKMKQLERATREGFFTGSNFVIHGKFKLSKELIKHIIIEEGGKVSNSLNPSVTHLLFSGSVHDPIFNEARMMDIHIVDEYFFRNVTRSRI